MATIDSLRRRKEKLLRLIELTKKRKKQVAERVKEIQGEYQSGKISEQIYKKKIGQALESRTLEQWVKYYDGYLNSYRAHLKLCNKLIRKEKYRGLRNKILLVLGILIILIVVGILISLLVIFRPESFDFLKDMGEGISSILEEMRGPPEKPKPSPRLRAKPSVEAIRTYGPPADFEETEILSVLRTASGEEEVFNKAKQGMAVLGKPVKWTTKIISGSEGLRLELPAEARVLKIEKTENGKTKNLTGQAKISERGIFRRRVEVEIEEAGDEYLVEYETDAPVLVEEELSELRKKVTLSSPDGLHYQNVLSSIEIPEILNKNQDRGVRVYQIEENGKKVRRRIGASAHDTDEDGLLDSVEFIAPYLSEASFIIVITKAEHLSSNRTFISDIYPEVSELDGNWSERIYHDEFIRVTFERELTNKNDITFYARNSQGGQTLVEVYYFEGEKITEFPIITEEGKYQVLLTDLPEGYSSDVFDLRIRNLDEDGGSYLEFDYIVDPLDWLTPGDISSCGYLGPGVYTLTQDVSPHPTLDDMCFGIWDSDVILDLNGYSVTGSYSDGINEEGVYMGGYIQNVTIMNGSISDFWYYGIIVNFGPSNNSIINVTVYDNDYGIYLYDDTNNNTLTNITATNNYDDAITINYDTTPSHSNKFINLKVNTNSDSWNDGAIILVGSPHNFFQDSSFTTTQTYLLAIYDQNNTCLNCSYALSKEYVSGSGEFLRKWHYQANVSYEDGTAIENANVSAYNRTGEPDGWHFNLTTNSTGWTNMTWIIDYINDGGTRDYYSNYTIRTTDGTSEEVHELNVTWERIQSGFPGLIFEEIFLEEEVLMLTWIPSYAEHNVDGEVTTLVDDDDGVFQQIDLNDYVIVLYWNDSFPEDAIFDYAMGYVDIYGVSGSATRTEFQINNSGTGNFGGCADHSFPCSSTGVITVLDCNISTPQPPDFGYCGIDTVEELNSLNVRISVTEDKSNDWAEIDMIWLEIYYHLVEVEEVDQCMELNKPGAFYTQTANISQTVDAACINITAQNITFDCRGYTINDSGLDISQPGIYSDQLNTTIRGCDVDMGTLTNGVGIYLRGANNSYIFNNSLHGQRNGLRSADLYNTRIENNSLSNNVIAGIYMASSHNNTITNNSILSNDAEGIFLTSSTTNNTIKYNFIAHGSGNNGADGIRLSAGSTENRILNNILERNDYAIRIFGGSYNLIANNLINELTVQNAQDYAYYITGGAASNIFMNNTIWEADVNILFMMDGDYNQFIGDKILSSSSNGLRILSDTASGSSHNIFRDMNLTNMGGTEVTFATGAGANLQPNNTFLNCSYELESVNSDSELIRAWYYQANVSYNDLAVENANVSAYNRTGEPDGWQFNLTTNSTGWTNITRIIDYININDVKNYYSNYTIDTTNGSLSESHKLNVTNKSLEEDFGGLIFDEIILEPFNMDPNITINHPPNNSEVETPGWALLNWSIGDLDLDDLEVWVWGNSKWVDVPGEVPGFDSLLYHKKGLSAGEYLYNWTSPLVNSSDPSLIFLFHFDNRSEYGENGTFVRDSTGRHNATCSDLTCPNFTYDGKFAGAYKFDREESDNFSISDHSDFDLENFTVMAWIKTSHTGFPIDDYEIFGSGSVSLGDAWTFGLTDDTDVGDRRGTIRIHANRDSAVRAFGTTNLMDMQWHFVTGVRNDTSYLLYVDGRLESVTPDPDAAETIFAGGNSLIGGVPTPDQVETFNGTIDELALFNRSLSASEIENYYNLTYQRYYWVVNVSDGRDTNTSLLHQFDLVGPPDIIPPIITVISPIDGWTYDTTIVHFNVSLNEDGDWCGLSLNGEENVTMTQFNDTYFNFTNLSMTDQTDHEVLFSCNDTSGNMNSTSVVIYFTVDTDFIVTPPGINFTFPTRPDNEITMDDFIGINVSIRKQTYPLGEVIFNWNGTNYTIYDDSLILGYNFNNLSVLGENGTLVRDITSTHNATCFDLACPDFTENGRFAGAYEFNMTQSDNFSISDHEDFDLENFTITAWVKSSHTGAPGDDYEVFGMGSSAAGEDWTFGLTDDGGYQGIVRLRVDQDSVITVYGIHGLMDMQWHQIAAVRNTTSYAIYVDGKLETVVVDPDAGETIYPEGGAKVGGVPSPNQMEAFNGSIDHLMLWDRPLSAGEINQMYFTNFYQYEPDKWNLFINQSKSPTAGLDDGTYTYQAFASDIYDYRNLTEERTISIVNAPPEVTLLLPFYSDILNDTNVTFKCEVSDEDELKNITLYGNWTDGWHANQTKEVTSTSNESIVSLNLTDKSTFKWNCYACDIFDNCGFAERNYTFTVDTEYIPPFTTIWIPLISNNSIGINATEFINASDDGKVMAVDADDNITVYAWNGTLSETEVLRYAIARVRITSADRGARTHIQTNITGEFETCGGCFSDLQSEEPHELMCHLTLSCGIDTRTEINNLTLRTYVTDINGPPKATTEEDYVWLDVAYKNRPIVWDVGTYDNETFLEKTLFERRDGMFVNVSVTDGEGQLDLDQVLITIFNPNNQKVLDNALMENYTSIDLPVAGAGYVYNYTWMVPQDAPPGEWTINITAIDRSGIQHSNVTNFDVAAAPPPVIIRVEGIADLSPPDGMPDVNPLAGNVRNITINFTVYEDAGFGYLNDDTAKVNVTKIVAGATVLRENLTCYHVTDFETYYANYSCLIEMMYFDEPGYWNITAEIANDDYSFGQNTSERFHYNALSEFNITPDYVNWVITPLSAGAEDVIADNNLLVKNLGNVFIINITVNASNLSGETYAEEKIPPRNFSVSNTSIDFCSGRRLIEDDNVSVELSINYSLSTRDTPASEVIGFCMKQVPLGIRPQDYKSDRDWVIEAIFSAVVLSLIKGVGVSFLLAALARKKKKRKKNLELFDKKLREKYIDFKSLLDLDESLIEKYGVGVEELLEIARKEEVEEVEEVRVPLVIFKQRLGPAEALCKYLKENLKLRFSEIAKLLSRDERTIWINYRNAVEKKKERMDVEERVLVSVDIFSDRRLSILEAIVYHLRQKGFRNSEISEILNKDQRNIWTVYSRARKKLGVII